jgi:hypothetical protein
VTAAETPVAIADNLMALLKSPARYDKLRLGAWERAKSLAWNNVLPPACDWLEAQAKGDVSGIK